MSRGVPLPANQIDVNVFTALFSCTVAYGRMHSSHEAHNRRSARRLLKCIKMSEKISRQGRGRSKPIYFWPVIMQHHIKGSVNCAISAYTGMALYFRILNWLGAPPPRLVHTIANECAESTHTLRGVFRIKVIFNQCPSSFRR